MKRTLTGLLALALLTGCTNGTEPEPGNDSPKASLEATTAVPDQGLAFDTMPNPPTSRDEMVECPYLDASWVAETNGQRVLGSGTDDRFDIPACVFWSYDEAPQLTVLVRTTSSESEAERVVNWAAPIDSTEPAEEPAGWTGGRAGEPGQALYSVYKGKTAVSVFSNQDQSLKAELVAKEVITNLGL